MLQRLIHRAVSTALAAVVTLSLFGVVDQLAQRDDAATAQQAQQAQPAQPAHWALHATARG